MSHARTAPEVEYPRHLGAVAPAHLRQLCGGLGDQIGQHFAFEFGPGRQFRRVEIDVMGVVVHGPTVWRQCLRCIDSCQ